MLIASLEKAIWNWMDTYPHEFTEIQVPNSYLLLLKYSLYNSLYNSNLNILYLWNRNPQMRICQGAVSSCLIFSTRLQRTINGVQPFGPCKLCYLLCHLKFSRKSLTPIREHLVLPAIRAKKSFLLSSTSKNFFCNDS